MSDLLVKIHENYTVAIFSFYRLYKGDGASRKFYPSSSSFYLNDRSWIFFSFRRNSLPLIRQRLPVFSLISELWDHLIQEFSLFSTEILCCQKQRRSLMMKWIFRVCPLARFLSRFFSLAVRDDLITVWANSCSLRNYSNRFHHEVFL